jgi:hypothetical protein
MAASTVARSGCRSSQVELTNTRTIGKDSLTTEKILWSAWSQSKSNEGHGKVKERLSFTFAHPETEHISLISPTAPHYVLALTARQL